MLYWTMGKEMHPNIKQILDAWPVYAVIATILTTLVVFYFKGQVEDIASAQIRSSVPISEDFLEIKRDIATLKNDGGDTEKSLNEVKGQLTRVEGKLDDLLLIMSSR